MMFGTYLEKILFFLAEIFFNFILQITGGQKSSPRALFFHENTQSEYSEEAGDYFIL